MRHRINVPFWAVCLVVALLGLSWMLLSYLLKDATGLGGFWRQVGIEISKAALVGSTVGVFLRSLVASPVEEGETSGVKTLYFNRFDERLDAGNVYLKAVQDPHTRHISIIGISLRDFLLASGKRHQVWAAIRERLKEEARQQLSSEDRLKVRILLLDPSCPEGEFRFQVEKGALTQGLREDVPVAINAVLALCRELDPVHVPGRNGRAKVEPVLEARLYQHGSFAFQFITDNFAIVEQYLYRDRFGDAGMPVIQYDRFSAAFEQIANSYKIIWDHAETAYIDETRVGLGRAIRSSALTGIFRAHDRPLLSQREQHAIHTGRSGDIIGIQALSGRFYINTAVSDIEAATRPAGQKAKMRFLVINPTSRSAILRAVADSAAIEDIGSALQDWSWDKHCHSKLYSDVHDTLRTIAHLRRAGCDVEVRLSAADLSCAMLLTRKSMFVEQYVYGRSKDFIKGVTLGGEQPVLEYTRRDESGKETEERILQSSFEVLWDSYSMAVEDYLRNTAEIVGFERELDALLTQVSREEPESVAKLVILAAGYGTQFSAESDQTSGAGGGKPKALLPIGGRPIIEWLLEGVDGIKEIADIIIVTNDKYLPAFVSWRRTTIQTKWRKLRIISDGTSSYDDRRGALGTLHFAVSREGIKGNLIILSGDNFFEHGIREIVDSFFAMRSSLVVVHPEQTFESARRFGVVEIDEERHIVNFEEKPEHPKTKIVGTGCYVLTQKDVRGLKGYVRDVERTDNMGEFIRYLIHQGSMVSALEYRGKWCDIGTYADYEDLRQTMED